jgi:two-component system chemotaxis response regulator CheY
MQILTSKQHATFLMFLSGVKGELHEWQLVNIRLAENFAAQLSIGQVSEILQDKFGDKEGRIYIGSNMELLMFMHGGPDLGPTELSTKVEKLLPVGSCEIMVQQPTPEGLAQYDISISFEGQQSVSVLSIIRQTRKENIVLLADDDAYMRVLVKKGIGPGYTVHEAADGGEVFSLYKKHMPDIVFLDIHMPGREGTDNLRRILAYDPNAYIIMLSADSSPANVEATVQQGAKGFLTKPFPRERLLSYLQKCPTITKGLAVR